MYNSKHTSTKLNKKRKEQAVKFYNCLVDLDIESRDVNKILKLYCKKHQSDYMINYSITKFCQLYSQEGGGNKEDLERWYLRIRHFMVKNQNLESDLFNNTEIVDIDQTYLHYHNHKEKETEAPKEK